jgi:hypothetical protein
VLIGVTSPSNGFGSLCPGLRVRVSGFGSLGLGLWVWVSGFGFASFRALRELDILRAQHVRNCRQRAIAQLLTDAGALLRRHVRTVAGNVQSTFGKQGNEVVRLDTTSSRTQFISYVLPPLYGSIPDDENLLAKSEVPAGYSPTENR